MSLQVNFTTHGHDLKAAYDAILRPSDPKSGDNWALFGYDKGTNDLKVLGQGNGGLEELEEEFMDGKIQYAFVRIIDPNSQLTKFILIAWCGDGVPESKKGLFNSHLADVAQFLKGYHLQINARCEADVTPAQIMKRVDEGSGSKYSIHKETYQAERITPLQSAYKRTEIPDIAALQRNPTKPEPAPKYGLASKPFGSSAAAPSTPPVTKPDTPTRSWNSPSVANTYSPATTTSTTTTPERSWKTSVGTSSYTSGGGASSFNKVAPPSSLSNYGQSSSSSSAPEPVVNKAHQIRLEREAREKEERERIKREIEASESRARQAQGQNSAQKDAEESRLQEQREREQQQQHEEEQQRSQDRAREERTAREHEERERAEAEDAARSAREAAKAREEAQARDQAIHQEEEARRQQEQQRQRELREREEEEEAAEMRLKQQQEQEEHEAAQRRRAQEEEEEEEEERRLQKAAANAPSRASHAADQGVEAVHAEEAAGLGVQAVVLYAYERSEDNEMSLIEGEVIVNVTELDVGWWSGESADGSRTGLFPANYVEVIEQSEGHAAHAAAPVHHEEQEDYHAHAEAHEPADSTAAYAAVEDVLSAKPAAVALYDYNAGEPNEISFSEGDVIRDIEFVTDDWWSGQAQDGTSGLFPSNYVELHQ